MKAKTYGEALKEATDNLAIVERDLETRNNEFDQACLDNNISRNERLSIARHILSLQERRFNLERNIRFYRDQKSDDYLYIPF